MSVNENELKKALQTGLKMFASDDVLTPNAWNQDLSYLQNLFVALLTGNLMIVDAPRQEPPLQPTIEPPAEPPTVEKH